MDDKLISLGQTDGRNRGKKLGHNCSDGIPVVGVFFPTWHGRASLRSLYARTKSVLSATTMSAATAPITDVFGTGSTNTDGSRDRKITSKTFSVNDGVRV